MNAKEKCPKCGKRGFYAGIGMFWGFRCSHCGYKAGNYGPYLKDKEKENLS